MAEMAELMAEKLKEGRESAIQLQSLLLNPLFCTDEAMQASAKQLAAKILGSYSETLSTAAAIDSAAEGELLAAVHRGEAEGRKKKRAAVKDRRGCYKRKRTSDSWVVTSRTMEDGCGWRKYGQKSIFNFRYPRCYYRCTYKSQGCPAIRQVQKIREDPLEYQMTYFNHHKCSSNHSIVLPLTFPAESENILSFQSTNIIPRKLHEETYNSGHTKISSTLDVESKEGIKRRLELPCGGATSSTQPPRSWDSIMGCDEAVWAPRMVVSNQQGGQGEEASGLYSCASTSFHELDMEVDQFGDINFDEVYGAGDDQVM